MRIRLRVSIVCFIIALLAAGSVAAQDAASAKRFVESLYRHYTNHGKGIDIGGPQAHLYLDDSLIALLKADAKAVGPNEVGVLDGDPICSCQDWDGIWDLKVAVQMLDSKRAKVVVSFALFAPKAGADRNFRSLEMALVSRGADWRIENILDKSDAKAPFDLRAELVKEIRTTKTK